MSAITYSPGTEGKPGELHHSCGGLLAFYGPDPREDPPDRWLRFPWGVVHKGNRVYDWSNYAKRNRRKPKGRSKGRLVHGFDHPVQVSAPVGIRPGRPAFRVCPECRSTVQLSYDVL